MVQPSECKVYDWSYGPGDACIGAARHVLLSRSVAQRLRNAGWETVCPSVRFDALLQHPIVMLCPRTGNLGLGPVDEQRPLLRQRRLCAVMFRRSM